jgi:hypothetical protein
MQIETMEHKRTEVSKVSPHKIVSKTEWLVARKDLLKREKGTGLFIRFGKDLGDELDHDIHTRRVAMRVMNKPLAASNVLPKTNKRATGSQQNDARVKQRNKGDV